MHATSYIGGERRTRFLGYLMNTELSKEERRLRRRLRREIRVGINLRPTTPPQQNPVYEHQGNETSDTSSISNEGGSNLSDIINNSEEEEQLEIMTEAEQLNAVRLIENRRRNYKSLTPTAFPKDDLEVIPWLDNYEFYISKVYGAGDNLKVENLVTYMAPTIHSFVKNLTEWKDMRKQILELAGPSSEQIHQLIRGLIQKRDQSCTEFLREVLRVTASVGRTENDDILRIYKEGLLSGIRERLVLSSYESLSSLSVDAQSHYETLKTSNENQSRLDKLESRILSVSDTVEKGNDKIMSKLVAVLQVEEAKQNQASNQPVPLLASTSAVHTTAMPTAGIYQLQAQGQSPINPMAQQTGLVQTSPYTHPPTQAMAVQCYNCQQYGHMARSCPFPRQERRYGNNRGRGAFNRGGGRGRPQREYANNSYDRRPQDTPQYAQTWGRQNQPTGQYPVQGHRGGNQNEYNQSQYNQISNLDKDQCFQLAQVLMTMGNDKQEN